MPNQILTLMGAQALIKLNRCHVCEVTYEQKHVDTITIMEITDAIFMVMYAELKELSDSHHVNAFADRKLTELMQSCSDYYYNESFNATATLLQVETCPELLAKESKFLTRGQPQLEEPERDLNTSWHPDPYDHQFP